MDLIERLQSSQLIFWDFDGVIKDSLSAKSFAFEKIFLPYGHDFALLVRSHHEKNVGISRFEKIPLYLEWAGENVSKDLVGEFCSLFSETVFQSVVDSPWVPGVLEWLQRNHKQKHFFLVTTTPQNEIEEILFALKIDRCFQGVFGTPAEKKDVIKLVLKKQKIMPACALMIGDAETDLLAANANSVPFLLRKTGLNGDLQASYNGPQFFDLNDE